jgi:hypothetical protein
VVCFDVLFPPMNQKIGCSNLSGRAIFSITYTNLKNCGIHVGTFVGLVSVPGMVTAQPTSCP